MDPASRLAVVERRLRELGPVLQSKYGPGQCIGIGAELVELADIVGRVRDLLAIVVDAEADADADRVRTWLALHADDPARAAWRTRLLWLLSGRASLLESSPTYRLFFSDFCEGCGVSRARCEACSPPAIKCCPDCRHEPHPIARAVWERGL